MSLLLKSLISFFLLITLLNLKFIFEVPDHSSFWLGVMFDNSGSMNLKDIDANKTRLDLINENFIQAPQGLEKLNKNYRVIPYSFSEKLNNLRNKKELLGTSESTNIDQALIDLYNRSPSSTLGGVLLFTDGNDNIEESIIRGAKFYQKKGIPISCIGLGSTQKQGDLKLEIISVPNSIPQGELAELKLKLTIESLPKEPVKVIFKDENKILGEKEIKWEDNANSINLSFPFSSYRTGSRNYSVEVDRLEGEVTYVNNVEFFGLEVKDPSKWNVLYIGNDLTWEYKYFQRMMDEQENFYLTSFVKMSDNSNYYRNFKEDQKWDEFPNFDQLSNFHTLVVDVDYLFLLKKEQLNNLLKFVEFRGGGLIFLGPNLEKSLPEIIKDLFPAELGDIRTRRSKVALEVHQSAILKDFFQTENEWNKALYLNAGELYQLPKELKLGTIPLLKIEGTGECLSAVQHFGSGKTGYMSFENTWSWVMSSDSGKRIHEKFWTRLLGWMSKTSKSALTVSPEYDKLERNSFVTITADVLGYDYLPTDHADVFLKIYEPGNKIPKTVKMSLSDSEQGKFLYDLFLKDLGDYHLNFEARIKGKKNKKVVKKIIKKSRIMSIPLGSESGESSLKEDLLKDVARLTNGIYMPWSSIHNLNEIPISKNVSTKKEVFSLNSSFILPFLTFLCILFDVYFRRRNGLR